MSKLLLTEEEFDLVKRQITRLYEHKTRTIAREPRRKDHEYKMLKGVKERLTSPGEQLLNRNDLRAIEGVCKVGLEALQTLIIPGYMERKSKSNGKESAGYDEYINKAQLTVAKYNGILVKIEGLL
jgi:hypothetical protein